MLTSKKILAGMLLLIVAAPIFFFAGLLLQQRFIRHEMKEKLESSLLQTITVSKRDFKWVKTNKEIIIEGKLFDVKEYNIKKDSVIFNGLYDEEESQLEKDIAGIMDRKKNESQPLEELILKFILTAVFKKSTDTVILPPGKNVKKLFHIYNEVAVTQSLAVNTPPPNS